MIKRWIALFLTLIIVIGSVPTGTFMVNASTAVPAGTDAEGTGGDGEAVDYLFGKAQVCSTFNSDEMLKDSFYYCDDWFFQNPDQRNDALALISMQLVAATLEGKEDSAGAVFLKKLGFEKIGFFGFDSPDPDDCAFMWGKKTIEKDGRSDTLLVVIIQSLSDEKSVREKVWKQNFTLNGEMESKEHYAFSLAAKKALPRILALSGQEDAKVWITGQSRGGAIANIIASKLAKETTYCRTFEAPATVEAETEADSEAIHGYKNIHNYICSDDIVTLIPPWGMSRYGTDIRLNIPGMEEKVEEELRKLGSKAAGMEQMNNKEEYVRNLVGNLCYEVKDRQTYSAKEEGCLDTANYQEAIRKLVGDIFNDRLKEISAGELLGHLEDLLPALNSLKDGILNHSEKDYRDAASGVYTLLNTITAQNPLSEDDVYFILKLAGKALIDLEVPDMDDPATKVVFYISPIIELYGEIDSLLYSHHSDTLIGRLKALAPAPKLRDIDIEVPQPQAGDSAVKMCQEVKEAIGADLTPSVKWEGNESTLIDNKTYYLDVELHAPGRDAQGFRMTINKQEPEREPQIVYSGGEYVIKATWKYVLGNPDGVTVSFDNDGIGEKPDPVVVEKGSRLGYAITPQDYDLVHKDGKAWTFQGWFDGQTSWEDVIAESDITLKASWKEVVDLIELNFAVPRVGETVPSVVIPEDAPYRLGEVSFMYEDYDSVEGIIEERGSVIMAVNIYRTEAPFYVGQDEEGEETYLGKVTVNGENVRDVSYEVFEGTENIRVEYTFTPLSEKNKEGEKKKTAVKDSYHPLKLRSVKQSKKAITLIWQKVSGASSYQIYGCPKGRKLKKLAVSGKNKYRVGKLKAASYYKYTVIAVDASGNQLARAKPVFVSTKGKGNYKSLVIKVKDKGGKGKKENARIRKSVRLKEGKYIKLKVTAKKTAKKLKKCVGIRFESSDPAIAEVSAKGRVKAKKRGSCQIYAFTQNGVGKSIKITVY